MPNKLIIDYLPVSEETLVLIFEYIPTEETCIDDNLSVAVSLMSNDEFSQDSRATE